MARKSTIGAMRERLVIQENTPDPISVTSLTRTSTTATATTATPHGLTTNDFAQVAGATPTGYNGKVKVTVTGPSTFTYQVLGTLATPATGTITVTYVSNAQGQPVIGWEDFATVPAELVTMSGLERMQAQAIAEHLSSRFRTWFRADITTEMRAKWTPITIPNAPTRTLEIHGVIPEADGVHMLLECGELAA